MIIKIMERPASSLRNILSYNEKEIGGSKYGELLATNVFGDTVDDRYESFISCIDKEKTKPIFHIPIRLAPGENLSNGQFEELAQIYMDRMGMGEDKFPYQVIRHHDVEDGEHIHLVISKTAFDGSYYSKPFYKKISNKVRQDLEVQFGLQQVGHKSNYSRDVSLNELNMQLFSGQKTNKSFLSQSINEILNTNPEQNCIRIDEFVKRCHDKNIFPIFNLQNKGEKVTGVSFTVITENRSQTFKGSAVNLSWNQIADKIKVYQEDSNYLSQANSIAFDKSVHIEQDHPYDEKQLKESLTKIASQDGVPSDVIESINRMKFKGKLKGTVNTFINQHSKGTNTISLTFFCEKLLEHKLSVQEHILFKWEQVNRINNSSLHSQAISFLKEHDSGGNALSWIVRYQSGLNKLPFESYLSAFEYSKSQKSFNTMIENQKQFKEHFCKNFKLDGNAKLRLMNTPVPPKEFTLMKELIENRGSRSDALKLMDRIEQGYSSFLKIKLAEILVHSGVSPKTAENLYGKFIFGMEKNNLDHRLLQRVYGLTQDRRVISELVKSKEIDHFFKTDKQNYNGYSHTSQDAFLSQFFTKLGSLASNACYEPDVVPESSKRKRRFRIS